MASFYPYVYVEPYATTNYFFIPMYLAYAVSMLIVVLGMRCVIRDAPNM